MGLPQNPPPEKNPPPWHALTGYVYRCELTGNMLIQEAGKERMLVVSEANELMEPTAPCVQSDLKRLSQKLEASLQETKEA